MQRFIENDLQEWSQEKQPMPILLRGARQVGKTYTIDKFARAKFTNYAYLNLETDKDFIDDFKSLDPHKIINKIFALKNINIEAGNSIIFIDEIQECPEAIVALRYFYEKFPGLHIVAAGSLLDFALNSQEISVPVGRILYMFMHPMSFLEFLLATEQTGLLDYIKNLSLEQKTDQSIHLRLIEELKMFMMLGGMPGTIQRYIENNKTLQEAFRYQDAIISTYQDDFKKYSKKSEQKYLKKVFQAIPSLVGKKLKYSQIGREFKSTDLRAALELLEEANIVNKVRATSPHSRPLEVYSSEKDFKTLFIDVGLMQKILGLDLQLIYSGDFHSTAAGGIAEQLVGQELLAYHDVYKAKKLFYWFRDKRGSEAEIDYLYLHSNQAIPIEVKSKAKGHLKSLKLFQEENQVKLGIKCSQEDLSFNNGLLSIPMYAVSEIDRLLASATPYF